jgi:hypothetical protein
MEKSKYTKFGRDLQGGVGLNNHLFATVTAAASGVYALAAKEEGNAAN